VENLRALQEDYPRLKVIKLEQNYRSTVRILSAANTLIANNPKLFEKRLWSDLGHGEAIQVTAMKDEEHEAESVVLRLAAHRFQHRTRYSDYAILYRGNHQARLFEQYLRNEKISYKLSGGTSFFERAEIRDLCSYLRLVANADDDPAFIRAATTPKRGIGPQTLQALGAHAGSRHVSMFEAVFEPSLAAKLKPAQLEPLRTFCEFVNRIEFRAQREPAGELLQELLRAIDYEPYLYDSLEPKDAEARWDNVQKFVSWLAEKSAEEGRNLIEMTQTVALMGILEGKETEQDAVQLSTLHAAKGLEFPYVFLVGVEEGILPHRESVDEARIDEERRLMYVGITRAQRVLFVSHCLKRRRAREVQECEPSRFIAEMGDDIAVSGETGGQSVSRQEGASQLAALKTMLAARRVPT
jgi:ATP-dependent DNA helicase Rep